MLTRRARQASRECYNPRMNATRSGRPWVALCLALALHVADEATHDFLSVYNPTVLALRRRIPWLPLPTFTFPVWLAGLIAAVILLLCLSPFAFRGKRWMRPISFIFALFMTLNGLQHIAGSIYMDRFMPGVYSSPFLLAASIWLLRSIRPGQYPTHP